MVKTYKTAYQTVMDGFNGWKIEFGDYHDVIAHSLLRAISFLESTMQRGETVYYIRSTSSLEYLQDKAWAMDTALEIHPCNYPGCFEVTKMARGYKVKTLLDDTVVYAD
jgi:hypothetical protein